MIPWEHSRPQAGSCATWTEEPLPNPSAGSKAALPARVWRRRAVHPAAVKTCSATLEMDFPQVRTWSCGPDDGFPQAARATRALEMRFPRGATWSCGPDDGFPQVTRASGALEMRFPRGATWSWGPDEDFPQATTGMGALEIEFPRGTTGSSGLKNGFLGVAACPERPQARFFSSLDEPHPLTR